MIRDFPQHRQHLSFIGWYGRELCLPLSGQDSYEPKKTPFVRRADM